MPGLRRQARIRALQLLYQAELQPGERDAAAERFWETASASRRAQDFAAQLYESAIGHQAEIDALLSAHLENWKLSRLPVIVRNLLRLAVAEMIHLAETPHVVVIDEAVEIAEDFADSESAKFVNAVLQRCWDRAGGSGPEQSAG